ncbi:hypothetical protein [Falsiroseomonas oryziterrae]|uniref:hypothetical protein n=1 Tax=Falsiroseomonas oryziterrae TaxID=2911368 RepID=UPI001F446D29|nr:hypothetical protein [Roseomonas sp. NPKOSM-4]
MMLYGLLQALALVSLGAVALGFVGHLAGAAADGAGGAGAVVWLAVLGLGVLLVGSADRLRREGRTGQATARLALVAVPGLFAISAYVAIGLMFTLGR